MSLTNASLAISIALVLLAAGAWLKLWASGGDGFVRDHLAPLAQWALGFLALHALCLIAAGDASLGSWALTAGLAFGAAVVQYPPSERELEDEEDEAPERVGTPAPAGHALWAGRADDPSSRAGLWHE